MKDIIIEAGGRTIPLVFDMLSWGQIEEEVGPLQDLGKAMDGPQRVKNVVRLVRIMANEGLDCAGEKPDLTDKWLGRNLNPKDMGNLSVKIMNAISAGMQMEASEDDGKKEVDVTLQEINKKKEPDG